MAAAASTLITTVKQTRPKTGEHYLNDGIYGGLMVFHLFPTLQPHYECVGDMQGETTSWTTYGPTCDPADVMPVALELPANLQEGDQVRFLGVGAYSLATATRFNGYGAIEVELV